MEAVSLTSLMMSAMLTKQQKLLLLFQRRNVVEDKPTDHSSTDLSSDDMAKKFQMQLSSTEPFERISALGKVASILKTYENPDGGLVNIDKKLVEGFYNRNFNDFQYLANMQKNLNEMKKT